MYCVDVSSIRVSIQCMSPGLNRSSVLQCFECGIVIEICNGTTFNFYLGLPHFQYCLEVGIRIVCSMDELSLKPQ